MPGVSVLPSSPGLSGLGSPRSPPLTGFPRSYDDMTVAEVKEKARDEARKVIRGASALSLIRSAGNQARLAQECELSGDLKGALTAFTKAAFLVTIFMDSDEFAAEGRRGVLFKELSDFQQRDGRDLIKRTQALEEKLKELEKTTSTPNGTDDGGPIRKPGGSIADRMRSLQDAGMSVSTTKRFSREIPTLPLTPPMSPESLRSHRISQSISSPPPQLTTIIPPYISSSAAPSPHAFVPPSSLGPPSPTSSASSSPKLSHFNLSDFTQAFPSIDELDESLEGLKLPSAPTASGSAGPSRPSPNFRGEPSPSSAFRTFPVLPVDPGPRPSSTPITPTVNSFVSRPASPVKSPLPPSPLSPPVPFKPPSLSLVTGSSPSPSSPLVPSPEKPGLPVTNSIFPKQLYDLARQPGLKVLLLDVRNRSEYDQEHIKADAVVCVEPSVLLRDTVTGSSIEDSLNVGPREEWALFCNREKFDLVAIYDAESDSFGPSNSPLSSLVRAIYETAFRKALKKPPVLLVGGLKGWKQDVGELELTRASESAMFSAEPRRIMLSHNNPSIDGLNASVVSRTSPFQDGPQIWTPQARPQPEDKVSPTRGDDQRSHYSFSHSRSPATSSDASIYQPPAEPKSLSRRPAVSRPASVSVSSSSYSRSTTDSITSPVIPQSIVNGTSSGIQYPQIPRRISPAASGSSFFTQTTGNYDIVSPPPQASINPSLSRRRSDYVDQSQEALSGLNARAPIDYPELSSRHILRPPPVAASSALERQDNRPRVMQHSHSFSSPQAGPKPPTIQSDYPVTYWSDIQIGTSGLKNLGNTCYMNSTLQCLSATVPFARFFTDGRWKSAVNMVNPLGTKGNLAHAFAGILHDMWQGDLPYLSPLGFRRSICMHASQFGGSDQHDSQEFLSFLLDGLHEDLNRILHKPKFESTPEHEAELERLPPQIASEQEWKIYRMRNDSLIVDFFQGQFRNCLECLTCHKTSTTYNTFMYLTLPVPTAKSSTKVTLQQCLEAFVKEEVMEKSDAWHCPNCKVLRKATKKLSLSRLPPVLLIHLKRFSFKGPFTDKIETFVDFPLKNLDLTNYMPPPLAPEKGRLNGGHAMSLDDPRTQLPPYRYDLYGVTNHFGSLSSGHYTAFVASRGGWVYCDDSRVTSSDAKEVVGRPAYVLYYKRTKV